MSTSSGSAVARARGVTTLKALLLADARREKRGMQWTTTRSYSPKRMTRTSKAVAAAGGRGSARRGSSSKKIHNSIVTFVTPSCNSVN